MLRAVIHKVHEIAAEVIRQTGKEKPADAALRRYLGRAKATYASPYSLALPSLFPVEAMTTY